MSGPETRTCARRSPDPVSPATMRPRIADVPVFGSRPGGRMLIGPLSPPEVIRIVCCCTSWAPTIGAADTNAMHTHTLNSTDFEVMTVIVDEDRPDLVD